MSTPVCCPPGSWPQLLTTTNADLDREDRPPPKGTVVKIPVPKNTSKVRRRLLNRASSVLSGRLENPWNPRRMEKEAEALRRKHEARTDAGAKRRDMRQKEKAGKIEQSRKMRQHFYQLQMEGRR